jgi:hypothetical protein
MDAILWSFGAALFGGIFQEVLHWWYLRTRLTTRRYAARLKNKGYWIITSIVVLMSAIGVAWFYGSRLEHLEVAILGAAFPEIFRKLVTAAKQQNVTLGSGEHENAIDLYFS